MVISPVRVPSLRVTRGRLEETVQASACRATIQMLECVVLVKTLVGQRAGFSGTTTGSSMLRSMVGNVHAGRSQ